MPVKFRLLKISRFKRPVCLALIFLSGLFLLASDLPERYRKWLDEEVVYLITPKEKEVFLKLQTDRERDIFIEAFWKQRDPTPETPRNEFREEHYRRLNYANQYLGRGTGKPGWKTDQGRIYIILGPPNNIEKYEDIDGVYPTQIWFYYGDPELNLPPAFNIIFFKKEGTGEYILYSPSDYGPQALVADYMYNARDARDAYQKLYRLSPNLAEQSLSLIPSERMAPGIINLASNKLLATVLSLPQRKIEDTYAQAWFKFKDSIEVEYSTNYLKADFEIWTRKDSQGNFLVNYSFEPAKLSVEPDGSNYLVKYVFNGRVSDDQGKTVYQFEKAVPLTISREELTEIGKRSISFQDVFPIIPGNYNFDLLVKNPLSKEFSSYSCLLNLRAESQKPQPGKILLAYDLLPADEQEGGVAPFMIESAQILVQARKSYVTSDYLVFCSQLSGLQADLREKAKLRYELRQDDKPILSREEKLDNLTGDNLLTGKIPLNGCRPGYYTLVVELIDGDRVLSSARAEFEVSTGVSLARPILVSKAMIKPEDELFQTGLQLLNTNRVEEACLRLAQAYAARPELSQALAYGEALFRKNDWQRVLEVIKPFDQPEAPAEVLSLLGRTYQSINQFAQATVYYEQYLNRFGLNVDILNYLGTCYFQLGDRDRALAIWEKSLSIDSSQNRLKELVRSLKED
ncbi:MAG TPA: GWxTD domain-containing protein [Candidatus Saccharicenans sp.]|nr:GWxTD domain-containing protein [Candidatus Saccharicenans sp.]